MGRPPKPTELARLQGNPSKNALPDDQPIPPKGELVPPSRLKGPARKYFKEFAATLAGYRPSLAYPADTQVLARYCEELVRYENLIAWETMAEAKKAKHVAPGLTYTLKTKAGKPIGVAETPQAKMIERLHSRLLEYEEQLGMTPKARSTMRVRALQATGIVQPDKPATAEHWTKGDPVVGRIGPQRA